MSKTETHNKSMPAPVLSWNISNLERNVADGKVTTVHYTVDATDGTYSAGVYGSVGVDGDLVTPYKDLTAATVVGWVKDQLGEEQVAGIAAALEARLEEQRAPKVAAGVPWAA
jgi:hypothetical protein